MSRLYPRLLPSAASRCFRDLQAVGPKAPGEGEIPSLAEAVFAATGGTRMSGEELAGVRRRLLNLAGAAGFPSPAKRADFSSFDAATARYLHESSGMTPGEASQRTVWSYFGLVLVPDICAWRYPPKAERGYLDDRFLGADLTRHTLAKLWFRAHLLHEPDDPDPYALMAALGEADIDQVLTRREDIACTPELVRHIARAHRDDPLRTGSTLDRKILRDSLKRLMRLASFMDFDGLSPGQLSGVVLEVRGLSRRALTS